MCCSLSELAVYAMPELLSLGQNNIIVSTNTYTYAHTHVHRHTHTHTDGAVLGVVLDSASEEELEKLDNLLSELANLKITEVTEGEKEVGVVEGEGSAWGTTVAEVLALNVPRTTYIVTVIA